MALMLAKLVCNPPQSVSAPVGSGGGSVGGGSAMDKAKLDALINKNAPFAPAPKQ
jgi:hypothetical protein